MLGANLQSVDESVEVPSLRRDGSDSLDSTLESVVRPSLVMEPLPLQVRPPSLAAVALKRLSGESDWDELVFAVVAIGCDVCHARVDPFLRSKGRERDDAK